MIGGELGNTPAVINYLVHALRCRRKLPAKGGARWKYARSFAPCPFCQVPVTLSAAPINFEGPELTEWDEQNREFFE